MTSPEAIEKQLDTIAALYVCGLLIPDEARALLEELAPPKEQEPELHW